MKISISLPAQLVAAIDAERGHVPRSTWIKLAIEEQMAANQKEASHGA